MTVKVYTRQGCNGCSLTKQWLVKHGVEFTEIDVDADEKARAWVTDHLGYRALPVVETDDDNWAGHRVMRLGQLVTAHG